ncbi:hypothetical protein B9Z19DRAFT_1085496 [Tuber borchii]|uniref:Uncharacterized protein n=1 Tax=Tuber borchii TaxID=42251 RepID=A0A2T6ZQN9_TUBBO|nr:hypothetical protein B9Z19DRAFT_1085496 [Tuber borchii]
MPLKHQLAAVAAFFSRRLSTRRLWYLSHKLRSPPTGSVITCNAEMFAKRTAITLSQRLARAPEFWLYCTRVLANKSGLFHKVTTLPPRSWYLGVRVSDRKKVVGCNQQFSDHFLLQAGTVSPYFFVTLTLAISFFAHQTPLFVTGPVSSRVRGRL